MKGKILLCAFMLLVFSAMGQQKRSNFKLMASLSGLGAAYEYNPFSVVYVQGNLTSTFTVTRFGIQSKLAVFRKDDFSIKVGVEGAYFLGDLRIGGVSKTYDQIEFMPLVAFEWKVVGIEIPVIVEPDLSSFFPMVAITLSVTNDEKRPVEKRKKRKDFQAP